MCRLLTRPELLIVAVHSAALTTGQKFDNFPPDSNIEALEVGH